MNDIEYYADNYYYNLINTKYTKLRINNINQKHKSKKQSKIKYQSSKCKSKEIINIRSNRKAREHHMISSYECVPNCKNKKDIMLDIFKLKCIKYLYSSTLHKRKTKRTKKDRCLCFKNNCVHFNQDDITIRDRVIDFFCHNIPLYFLITVYGSSLAGKFSKICGDTINLLALNVCEYNIFISWMKNTFNESFIDRMDTTLLLFIGSITINFKCVYEKESDNRMNFLEYNICTQLSDEYSNIKASFDNKKQAKESNISEFKIFDDYPFNMSIDKIIKQRIENLNNKIITLHEFPPLNRYSNIFEKVTLLHECYSEMKKGYTILDPLNILPGLVNIIVHTYTTKDINQITGQYLLSLDTCGIILEYLKDHIIDPDYVCPICDHYEYPEVHWVHDNKDGMKFIKPIIKSSHGSITCFHGFYNKKPELIKSNNSSNQIIVHLECFSNIVYSYQEYGISKKCKTCDNFYI